MARLVALILVVSWPWPTSPQAQSRALDEAYPQGQTLFHAGRYEEAIPFWRKALELGEREFGPDQEMTAIFLNNLALLYKKSRGRYADAEPLYQRALAIREKALGKGHPLVAQSLETYAALLRATGRGAEANKMEARAKDIRAKDKP